MLKFSDMRSNSVEAGFTLVELMVTIVIFSFIMLMLFSSFSSFVSTGQKLTRAISADEDIVAGLNRIRRDFLAVYVVPNAMHGGITIDDTPDPFRFLGEQIVEGGRTFSKLSFASMAVLTPHGSADPARITYYVRQTFQGGFDLMRYEGDTDTEPDPCRDPVLVRNISRFDLGFIDPDQNLSHEWDSDDRDVDERFPVSIQVAIAIEGEAGRPVKLGTAILLPVNREARG